MDVRRCRMAVTSRTGYVRTGALVDEQLRHWLARPPKRYDVDAFAEAATRQPAESPSGRAAM